MTWFVLRARYNHESSVAGAIIALGPGYRSFCPVRNEIRIIRRKKDTVRIPLWTTYVLADWPDDGGVSWHRVMDVDGVTGIIGGGTPMPVQESEVAEWVEQADETGVVTSMDVLLDRIRRGYGRGDRVKIEGGPFSGAVGICNWYDASGVSIKTALLGREVNIYASSTYARVVKDDDSVVISRSMGRRDRRRTLSGFRSVSI